MSKFDYARAEQLNYRLLDQFYTTGWNNSAFELFSKIMEDCRMCGRCRKCNKYSKPYRSLFLLALEDADKVLVAGISTNEWLYKFEGMYYYANCECHTYNERNKKEMFFLESFQFEQDIIRGKYDRFSDKEFNNILINKFIR